MAPGLFAKDPQKQGERLIRAIEAGRPDSAYYEGLITSGADLNMLDVAGNPPILCAAEHNNVIAAIELIKAGVDVNVKDRQGKTPLHLAAFNGNLVLLAALVNAGADINAQDAAGLTPLMWTACYDHMHCAKFLLEKGAKLTPTTKDGKTALDIAEERSSRKVAELITQKMLSQPERGRETAPIPKLAKRPFRPPGEMP